MRSIDRFLLKAVIKGNLERVIELIAKGADVNIADEDGKTPLYLATTHRHIKIVKILIKNGAKLDKRDKYGWTPLHEASRAGYIEIVKLFLKIAPYTAKIKESFNYTPLHEACLEDYVKVVNIILAVASDTTKVKNNYNATPLYDASYYKNEQSAKSLLTPIMLKLETNFNNTDIKDKKIIKKTYIF